jgi:hypothetical protein
LNMLQSFPPTFLPGTAMSCHGWWEEAAIPVCFCFLVILLKNKYQDEFCFYCCGCCSFGEWGMGGLTYI